MKRVRRLQEPKPGLTDYLQVEGEMASWVRFRSHDRGRAYREIIAALMTRQHGLCGYCESRLTDTDRQVEHVVPQSDPRRGASLALDVRNLMACCTGNTARRLEAGRYLKPARHSRSCGEAKGGRTNGEFVDPRELPELPSVVRVIDDGRIEADAAACLSEGVSAQDVARTIALLNLNAEHLRVHREKRWRGLNDAWEKLLDAPGEMQAAARSELLPAEGRLPQFFTTSRSYFGPVAERVLGERPRAWV